MWVVNIQHDSVLHEPSYQLRDHTARLNDEFSRGNYVQVMRLIEGNVLSSLYGNQTDHFRGILEVLIQQGVDHNGVARTLLSIVTSPSGGAPEEPVLMLVEAGDEELRTLRFFSLLADHRMRGRTHKAENMLDLIDSFIGQRPCLTDMPSGWRLMLAVQCGITAMLAGDFTRAQAYFAAARLHTLIPSLAFLTRDAYVKTAMICAVFGDPDDAAVLLSQARNVPRTSSWAEPLIDADVKIVEALLNIEQGERALAHLESIPLYLIGEMWPFYVLALHRCAERAGKRRQFLERLTILEQAHLPRMDGQGVPGSVFQVIRAITHLRWNDFEEAKRLLATADPHYVGVKIVAIFVEIDAGRPSRALKLAEKLVDHRVSGLRLVELWRYVSVANAYLRLGRVEQTKEALRAILSLPGGLRNEDTALFFEELLEFAQQEIPEWPPATSQWKWFAEDEGANVPRLTSREFDVIRQLASKRTQQEIASEMFVSVNTLKSHLKAIYKKLGVQSRESAVLRAEKEGWL